MLKRTFFLISLVLLLGLVSNASAYDTWVWDNDNGNGDRLWQTAANWEPSGVPAAGDWACIDIYADADNGPIINAGTDGVCQWLDLGGWYPPTDEVVLTMTGGSLTVESWLASGYFYAGTYRFDISGGTLDVGADGFTFGWVNGSYNTLNISGGTINSSGPLSIGIRNTSQAYMNMTGGTINLGSWLEIGSYDTLPGTGHINLHGGIIRTRNLAMGGGGVGTIDVTEGVLIIDADLTKPNGWLFDPLNDTANGGGSYTGTLSVLIARGLITAYDVKNDEIITDDVNYPAEAGLRAVVNVDYDVTNPGKTTLSASLVDPNLAWNPSPASGSSGQLPVTILSWSPGENAASHDVYFGDSFAEVNDANTSTTGIYQGAQNRDANTFSPGPLVCNSTYYWRIDEVNDSNTWKGHVWSFTVAPATAFDPSPADGASDVSPCVVLSWKPGAEAFLHNVYFSTDFNDVNGRDAIVLTIEIDPCHNPGPLELATAYYWVVDEVNLAAEPNTWKGDVWSFTTYAPSPYGPYVDRAVYWDARYPTCWTYGTYLRDAFASASYNILDADRLKSWMDARIADGMPSVVVFCQDIAPDTVVESMSSTCTLRQYLDAGGKIVWYADIPMYYQGHSNGSSTTWWNNGSVNVLGFDAASGIWDSQDEVTFTADGITWGLTQTWLSVRPTLGTGLRVLAEDASGYAAAWVKHYVPGDSYRGFVRLFDIGGQPNFDDVRRLAEYFPPVTHTPSGIVVGPVGAMSFDFAHPMDESSFSLVDDIVSFTGPEGSVTVTGCSWVNSDTLEVTFEARATGQYEMVIGPNILDLGGNAMDQDRDLVPGEVPDDRYEGMFTLTHNVALQFDGIDDYLLINSVADDVSGSITVEAWVNAPAIYTGTSRGAMVGVNTATGDNVLLLLVHDGNSASGNDNEFVVHGSSGWEGDSDTLVADGTWHHIAYTADGITGTLYVDGLSKATHTVDYIFSPSDQWSIGQEFDSASKTDFFEGIIDEVRIWNVARTQDEIQSDMYTQFDGYEPGLIGYWRLNEGSGQIAGDSSGSENDGQLGSTSDSDGSDPTWVVSSAPVRGGFWITGHTPNRITSHPVSSVDITFSRDVNTPSFTIDDVNIMGPNGPIDVNTFEDRGKNVWRLSFVTQSDEGKYHIYIDPNIEDLQGDKIDQDGDWLEAEYPDDIYDASFSIYTIYVNGETGNDSWTGTSQVYQGGSIGSKKTIQAGIDIAGDGARVLVAQGTYVENVNFHGKKITVRAVNTGYEFSDLSEFVSSWLLDSNAPDFAWEFDFITDGIINFGDFAVFASQWNPFAESIIDGNSSTAITFDSGEDSNSVLEGFTITNSSIGISCQNSSPTITHNTIQDSSGAAIYCSSSARPYITCNTITNNNGYGIHCVGAAPSIGDNFITDNNSDGIYCESGSEPRISNNNIFNNAGLNLNNADATIRVHAILNWWGDANGPLATATNTAYEPWLAQPFAAPFKITNGWVSTNKFSQNGGSSNFYFTLSEDANCTIKILNDSQQVVKTLNEQGESLYQEWDGVDDTNSILPSGIYTYQVEATSNVTSQAAAPATGNIELDDAIPIAKITSPPQDELLTGDITLAGTATSTDFQSYQLQYGISEHPVSWTSIYTAGSPVTDSNLATWDTADPTRLTYTVRLTVTDNLARRATDQVIIHICNIYGVSDNPHMFSPNGDQIKDDTIISASVTIPIDWTMTIKDPCDQTVKTFTGSGDTISQVWDGTDDGEVNTVPDGIYSYYIDGTELASSLSILQASGTVALDNTPPVANMTYPSQNEDVFHSVDINGTAFDDSISSYVVEYGVGASPSDWTVLATGTSSVTDGILASWDTNTVANGLYTLMVTVLDEAGNESTTTLTVNVDNLYITNVSTAPKFIDPYLGEDATLYYTLNKDANVTIDLYRAYVTIGALGDGTYYSNLVMSLVDGESAYAGINAYVWDGRGADANIVQHSAYVYAITAQDPCGRSAIFDPAYVPGNASVSDVSVTPTDYNPYSNEPIYIDYTLSVPAWVTIGGEYPAIFPGFLLRGAPRDAGPNVEVWDGRDGNLNIVQEDFLVSMKTELLPEICTVIRDTTLKISELQTEAYRIIPTYNQISTIYYSITRDADVVITISDPVGNIWTISSVAGQTAGIHTVEWDGTDALGRMVSREGNYRVEVSASDGTAQVLRTANITVYK